MLLIQGCKEPKQRKRQKSIDKAPRPPREKKESESMRRAAAFYAHVVPPAEIEETRFRHSHWKNRRDRIRAMLARSGARVHALNRWDECGGQCQVQWSESRQNFRLSANYCKSRFCEPCMRAKANMVARNLREKLEEARQAARSRDPIGVRFITLTLRHNKAPLKSQIDRLHASFKKLRNLPLWKLSQLGGAAALEVKWTGVAWHPHLHVVAEGSFISKEQLSQAWHECTGDSFVVDVRALKDLADACHYVSKYITKGTNDAVWLDDDRALEWITASRGVRICNTFGSWRGFKLTKPTSSLNDWKPIRSLINLLEAAQAGELAAQAILLILRPPGQTEETRAPRKPSD